MTPQHSLRRALQKFFCALDSFVRPHTLPSSAESIVMKTNQVVLHLQTVSPELNNDSTKLISLLALAAGAIAMPQTGIADIIYTDLGGSPATVGYGAGSAEYQVNIPGTATFKFVRREGSGQTGLGDLTFRYRSVIAGDFGPVNAPCEAAWVSIPERVCGAIEFWPGVESRAQLILQSSRRHGKRPWPFADAFHEL